MCGGCSTAVPRAGSDPAPSRLNAADGRHPAAAGTGSSPVKFKALCCSQQTGALLCTDPCGLSSGRYLCRSSESPSFNPFRSRPLDRLCLRVHCEDSGVKSLRGTSPCEPLVLALRLGHYEAGTVTKLGVQMIEWTGKFAYKQVADDLRRRIADDEFTETGQLPSLAQLQERYASRDVARAAINQLKHRWPCGKPPGQGRSPTPNAGRAAQVADPAAAVTELREEVEEAADRGQRPAPTRRRPGRGLSFRQAAGGALSPTSEPPRSVWTQVHRRGVNRYHVPLPEKIQAVLYIRLHMRYHEFPQR